MAEVKEKHPTWFKMKIERRQLVKQLEPKTAVNVLLACWDYLETGEHPTDLSVLEQVAFSAFFPDMEEAWENTTSASIAARTAADLQRQIEKPYGSIRYHTGQKKKQNQKQKQKKIKKIDEAPAKCGY